MAFALSIIERAKRDRKPLGYVLNLCAGALVVLALQDKLLEEYPTQVGWYTVSALAGFGPLYLLFLEDWAAGRSGPHFQTLAATLRDLATGGWWFWFSKTALTLRAREKLLEGARKEREEQERSARKIAEDRAAAAAAERRSSEDSLAAAQAAEAAAAAQRMSATEQQRADEASRRAADAQERRSDSESRSAAARKQIEELSRDAESAALERTRLRAEQIDAERRFLEAAVSAHAAAEIAVQKGVEVSRARQVLERIHDEELAEQLALTVAATDSPQAGFALHVDPGAASPKDVAELLAAARRPLPRAGRQGPAVRLARNTEVEGMSEKRLDRSRTERDGSCAADRRGGGPWSASWNGSSRCSAPGVARMNRPRGAAHGGGTPRPSIRQKRRPRARKPPLSARRKRADTSW